MTLPGALAGPQNPKRRAIGPLSTEYQRDFGLLGANEMQSRGLTAGLLWGALLMSCVAGCAGRRSMARHGVPEAGIAAKQQGAGADPIQVSSTDGSTFRWVMQETPDGQQLTQISPASDSKLTPVENVANQATLMSIVKETTSLVEQSPNLVSSMQPVTGTGDEDDIPRLEMLPLEDSAEQAVIQVEAEQQAVDGSHTQPQAVVNAVATPEHRWTDALLQNPSRHVETLLGMARNAPTVRKRALAATLLAEADAEDTRVDVLLARVCLSDTAVVSIAAGESLLARGARESDILLKVVSLAAHKQASVRHQVACTLRYAAGTPDEEKAVSALLSLLGDQDSSIRSMAALTLGDFRTHSVDILDGLLARHVVENNQDVIRSLELAVERVGRLPLVDHAVASAGGAL